MITVSIIIPMYNSAETIVETLKSVLQSDEASMEIIVVDDGSTDDSANLVKKLKKVDNRIKLIQQANKGVSAARNLGMQNAIGEYYIFLDSDDILSEKFVDCLIENVQKTDSDLVVAGIDHVGESKVPKILEDKVGFIASKNTQIGNQLIDMNMGQANGKLYRASIIRKHSLTFNEGLSFGEDLVFAHEFVLFCTVVSSEPKAQYRVKDVNPSSLSKSFIPNVQLSIAEQNRVMKKCFERFPKYKEKWFAIHMDLEAGGIVLFSKNLFLSNSPYSFGGAVREIREKIILSGKIHVFWNLKKDAMPKVSIDKLFYMVFRTKSAFLIALFFFFKEKMRRIRSES